MNENLTTRLLWLSAAVLLVAGFFMTIQNLRNVDTVSQRAKKSVAELNVLRNMEADMARYEAAKLKLEQLSDKHPVSLTGVLQEALPGVKTDEVRDLRKDLGSGWVVRQKEIALNDIPIGKAMEFVQKAEKQKLPWCLAKCVIRATPRVAGTGQVVLLMEAVEKVE